MYLSESQSFTKYSNQYFKLKMFIKWNRKVLEKLAIQHDKHSQIKMLVNVYRSGWHLCKFYKITKYFENNVCHALNELAELHFHNL